MPKRAESAHQKQRRPRLLAAQKRAPPFSAGKRHGNAANNLLGRAHFFRLIPSSRVRVCRQPSGPAGKRQVIAWLSAHLRDSSGSDRPRFVPVFPCPRAGETALGRRALTEQFDDRLISVTFNRRRLIYRVDGRVVSGLIQSLSALVYSGTPPFAHSSAERETGKRLVRGESIKR